MVAHLKQLNFVKKKESTLNMHWNWNKLETAKVILRKIVNVISTKKENKIDD